MNKIDEVTKETLFELLAMHGGKIISSNELEPMWIEQARASGRFYVADNSLGYVWEPDITDFPTTTEEVDELERWYPNEVPLPDHLKNPDFLSRPTPPQPVTEGKAAMYIVTAYRWQNKEKHSYPVGVFTSEQLAIEAAEMETAYRGGLYSCSVDQCFADYYNQNLPNYTKEVYQTQIPEHYKKATSTPSPTPAGDWEAEAEKKYPFKWQEENGLRTAYMQGCQRYSKESAAMAWDAGFNRAKYLNYSMGNNPWFRPIPPDRETFLSSLK